MFCFRHVVYYMSCYGKMSPRDNNNERWNVVDGCGAKGEPAISGLFTRDMQPKAAYFAMDDLVNREWKTTLSAHVAEGKVVFRGFRGRYRLSWTDTAGKAHDKIVEVK